MDISEIAQTVTAILLPYLAKIGDKASEEAGETLAEETWAGAKSIWNKLAGKFSKGSMAAEAEKTVLEDPQDVDAVAAFRLEIKKLMQADAQLRGEIEVILAKVEAQPAGIQNKAIGDRSIAIAGPNSGTADTGDRTININP